MRDLPDLPSDAELVARLRTRDETAFALVLDAWSGGMTRVARSIVSTSASADEVVQDAWLAVVKGIGAFESRSSLKTWVFRVLVNTAKRRAMREGRHMSWSLVPGEDDGPTVDPTRFRGTVLSTGGTITVDDRLKGFELELVRVGAKKP